MEIAGRIITITVSGKEGYSMDISVIGYPRIGELRELKFACERYFRKEVSYGELEDTARALPGRCAGTIGKYRNSQVLI